MGSTEGRMQAESRETLFWEEVLHTSSQIKEVFNSFMNVASQRDTEIKYHVAK
jgi:hypothetical protein